MVSNMQLAVVGWFSERPYEEQYFNYTRLTRAKITSQCQIIVRHFTWQQSVHQWRSGGDGMQEGISVELGVLMGLLQMSSASLVPILWRLKRSCSGFEGFLRHPHVSLFHTSVCVFWKFYYTTYFPKRLTANWSNSSKRCLFSPLFGQLMWDALWL
jgi:hypothetical protein